MKVDIKDLGPTVRDNVKAQLAAGQRAVVRTLNRAPGILQDTLIEAEKRVFKAPVAFTTNPQGYKQTLARMGQADPVSKFGMKDRQSQFLRLQITGGERDPGDAGAWGAVNGHSFVFTPTTHSSVTASGSLTRNYSKTLAKEAKRKTPKRGGGVFFGTLHGHDDEGYLLRPGRTKALMKQGRGGKLVLARPHDAAQQVHAVGTAEMLIEADPRANYKARLPYQQLARAAMDKATADLGRRLNEELRK